MMQVPSEKPGRPLGVTLAILLSVFLFTVYPLVIVAGVLIIENRFEQMAERPEVSAEEGIAPVATGGDFRGGITDAQLLLQGGLALVFLVLAFFAWRGRPAFMRYVFMAAVLLLTLVAVLPMLAPDAAAQEGLSGGSLEGLFNSVYLGRVVAAVLVALYVIWYLNRGPARAFYRGYYLPEPENARSTGMY